MHLGTPVFGRSGFLSHEQSENIDIQETHSWAREGWEN